jgi:hypothetical protein
MNQLVLGSLWLDQIAVKKTGLIVDNKGTRCGMKKLIDSKRAIKSKPTTYHGLDSHEWATKMEIQRLLSGKPDLKIKLTPSAHQAVRK